MPEHRHNLLLKARENMSNMACPNQHIDIEIPHGSRDYVIVPHNLKTTFDLDN